MSSNRHIDAREMAERIKSGLPINVLDVREAMEYHTFNIGGTNIPLGKLPDMLPLEEWDSDDEIIVLCKMGLRSKTAVTILQQNGYTNARNLTGGLIALQKLK
ncbi:rhodanese-like domain-containing protein [Mucilaginibacter mali]|uniref:Rhodanese-like domain-containing protein n=1 Tax=Mucilaginibacter mali TaxID=2740462 RepID=A0A7D4QKQ4_9SPHI|nr:rhodanese-like domain-containing protein [Mucilaginibacter mali]QKJ30650.1 rhodanese-like domain-containing protein [Mucilaginibacter mali]